MKLWIGALALLAALAGCGGGGGDAGTCKFNCGGSSGGGGTTSDVVTVSLALSAAHVSAAVPAEVTATVLDNRKPVAGVVVTFAVDVKVGLLAAPSALTNADGVATVKLSPAVGVASGADTLTASVTVNKVAATASAGYDVNGAAGAAIATFARAASAPASAPAYGQIDLNLVLSNVSPAAPAIVSLTSDCVGLGKASISPSSVTVATTTPVLPNVVYKDAGCGAVRDTDTISAAIGSGTPSTVTVGLIKPKATALTFIDATPNVIYLKGSGLGESSTVRFRVVDTAGNPLPNQSVTLDLTTYAGGVLLDQGTKAVTKTSDANGYVPVLVNSGTVPTPFRVTATLADSGFNTVSSKLAIVTGLPSQLNFSLSQTTINIEGYDLDGTPNSYTVLAADRSGNPVPDGTSVIFWSEGGQVQGTSSTTTTNGIASAKASFVSAQPKPLDGRVTVLAYAIGEESFVDANGDNVWNVGEPFQMLGNIVKSRLYDSRKPYMSDVDEIVKQPLGDSYSGTCVDMSSANPLFAYSPNTPNQPATCQSPDAGGNPVWSGRRYVRRAVETIFSTSYSRVFWGPTESASQLPGTCVASVLQVKPTLVLTPPSPLTEDWGKFADVRNNPRVYVGAGKLVGSVNLLIADTNPYRANPMPAGTIISASPLEDNFKSDVAAGSPIPSTANLSGVTVAYNIAAGMTESSFILKFTTPSGIVTSQTITVVPAAPPSTCTLF